MNKDRSFKKVLPTVLCECGEEILVIADLDKMTHCIETHAIIHMKKEADPEKAKAEHRRIEEQLTRKVIIKIIEMENRDV